MESTPNKILFSLAILFIALRSVTFNKGFVGVSIHNNLVFDLIALLTSSGFDVFTYVNSNP